VEPVAVTVVTTSTSVDAGAPPESFADAVAPAPAPPRDTARYREGPRARRRIGRGVGRVVLFVVPILLIVGVAIGTIGWYARNSYFLAFDHGRVTIYRGRPGGLLFWDPEVVTRTNIARSRLTALDEHTIAAKKEFSDLATAKRYVSRARSNLTPVHPTTSTTTSTTTLPGAATSSTTTAAKP
jgi:hypothetical protein